MYLNESKSRALSDVLQLLAGARETDDLRQELAKPIAQLVEADYLSSRDWDPVSGKYSICAGYNVGSSHVQAYDAYYQFHDPVTPKLKARRYPTRVSDVISQDELVRTEFFNDFLRRDELYWGVNLYAFAGADCVGDLVIFRSRQRKNFDLQSLQILGLIQPAFTAALVRLQKKEALVTVSPPLPDAGLSVRLLTQRGHLSPREAEVAVRASRGDADKEIARDLGIEFSTVRYYLANVFRKLNVDGRIKLVCEVNRLLA